MTPKIIFHAKMALSLCRLINLKGNKRNEKELLRQNLRFHVSQLKTIREIRKGGQSNGT